MENPRYALVGYVKGPAGEFVENLRRELHPDLPHLAAHLTLLPPRFLRDTETSALQLLERICGEAQPFEVALGDVETFTPATPTVYIRVSQGAERMCELHGQLNTQALECREEWPYTPHMTIAKMAAGQLGAECLPDCPRTLGQLCREPAYLVGTVELCPRRRAELLGRPGPSAAGTNASITISIATCLAATVRLPLLP